MPNDYFQFKQFKIIQDKCAMKVCTDACLFGAWVAEEIKSKKVKVKSILDVGAGTGLLSLMLAQKIPAAVIDAVEIDKDAAEQARENFEASAWKERLRIHHTSIQQFGNSAKYDLIISNPPFYQKDLKSDDEKRNLALHSAELTFEELLRAVQKHLDEDGLFAVMLPFSRSKQFINLSIKQSLHLHQQIRITQTPKHDFFRSILLLGKEKVETTSSSFTIMEENNHYTSGFRELLQDYYLYL